MRIRPVVLCGGAGTRLWPLSNAMSPKQFLPLTGQQSMLASTLARVAGEGRFERPLAIGSLRHGGLLEQEADGAELLLEPVARNSAPPIAAACLLSRPDELLLILPADHHILDTASFLHAIETGAEAAIGGDIVTFGIEPDHPATGYGYIEAAESGSGPVQAVARFVEKPDLETATGYIKTGRFYWNAGIFLFRADTMIKAFQDHAPDILQGVAAALDGRTLDRAAFEKVRSESIDYAVLEYVGNISVVPASMGWSDVGDFRALHGVLASDADSVVTHGPVTVNASRSVYVRSSGPAVAVHGLSDVAVVATHDEVLVTRLSEAAAIKPVVNAVRRLPTSVATTAQADWIRDWLWNCVMPLWAEHAVDPKTGRLIEALDLNGAPLADSSTRGRVAPRQLYAFAVAKQFGWNPGGAADRVIEAALTFLDGPGRAPGGGWAHRIAPDGSIEDGRRDLYDHAFVALAGSQLALLGLPDGRRLADEAFAVIDETFLDPEGLGWSDRETGAGEKLANPHMHLLEASLAHYSATAEPSTAKRLAEIAFLFERHMFDPRSGAMLETFATDWSPLQPHRIEPGHCYEWAFLLDTLRRSTGRDTASWCRRLVDFSEAGGLKNGLVVDLFGEDPATARLWPQLERIRTLSWIPRPGCDVGPVIDIVIERYLSPGPAFAWVDKLSAEGEPLTDTLPASMLYHFMTALAPIAPPR